MNFMEAGRLRTVPDSGHTGPAVLGIRGKRLVLSILKYSGIQIFHTVR